jgi:hypothetical protein
LHNNKKWIRATARDLKQSLKNEGIVGSKGQQIINNHNYNQIINSPKALTRLEIYRQSKNLLGFNGGAF